LFARQSGRYLHTAYPAWRHSTAGLLDSRRLDHGDAGEVDWIRLHRPSLRLPGTVGVLDRRWLDDTHAGRMEWHFVVGAELQLPGSANVPHRLYRVKRTLLEWFRMGRTVVLTTAAARCVSQRVFVRSKWCSLCNGDWLLRREQTDNYFARHNIYV